MSHDIGKRVELHPATDAWMRGDRFGTIVGLGRIRQYVDSATGAVNLVRPYRVRMDKSGRILRQHPENVIIL